MRSAFIEAEWYASHKGASSSKQHPRWRWEPTLRYVMGIVSGACGDPPSKKTEKIEALVVLLMYIHVPGLPYQRGGDEWALLMV